MAVHSEDPEVSLRRVREDTAMIQNDVLLGRSNLIQLPPIKSIEALLNFSQHLKAIFKLGKIS